MRYRCKNFYIEWCIVDKITGVYKPHEYGEVILPLTVLKRFDYVLSDTKEAVLEAAKKYPESFAQRDMILKETSKQNFYNTSKYDFKKLLMLLEKSIEKWKK